MFQGTFNHTIDKKGRVSIPSKFREVLKEKYSEEVMLTRDADKCLIAYPMAEWNVLAEKAKQFSRYEDNEKKAKRFIFSEAEKCALDKAGRILIPPILREYAELDKEIAIIGNFDTFEIWSKQRWEEYNKDSQDVFKNIREKIEKLGL